MRPVRASEASVDARQAAGARPEGVIALILLLAFAGSTLAVFAGPPDPGRLPALPSWGTLEVLARSPNPPLDGVFALAVLIAWLVWAWAAASVAVELALAVAEHGPAQGAAWLRTGRAVADRLTLPLARRAVAAAIVVQLATRPALPALAFAVEPPVLVSSPTLWDGPFLGAANPRLVAVESPEPADDMVHHVVQRGETLWSIAERYYGSGEEFDRVIDANIGRPMPDGRVLDRAGLIYPGWVLDIPLPSPVIEERDGARYYVVQRGDTLSGVAARLLGDPERYHELFELNVGTRLGEDGPSLSSPDLIWPELRLRLPGGVPATEEPTQADASVQAETTTPAASDSPTPVVVDSPTAAPVVEATPEARPTRVDEPPASDEITVAPEASPAPAVVAPPPTAPTTAVSDGPQSDTVQLAAIGAIAGGAAGLGLAGARVLRRRRRRHEWDDEPTVTLDEGFVLSDPARILGQRLSGESDAATDIANRLARSFATVLTSSLSEAERSEVFGTVELVAVRHGQTSTTCILSAPPVVRGQLLRHLEAAVAGAFGDAVDIEGLVSHDGDLFIQLAGLDQRRLRVAVLDDTPPEQRLWPDPLLVALGLLHDRQTLYANWHALSHVLIAAPLGQAAETILAGLTASLVARRPPAELALVTLASPRTLPRELVSVPHQLTPIVDPADQRALRTVFQQLRDELDRRAAADSAPLVDVAIVVRELADLRREDWDLLAPLLSDGPQHRVRVLAASERTAADLTAVCPLLDEFRTRLVMQTADEDSSQALLGAAGAEELGPGGNMLVRLEARTPVRAHGLRVPPDHLVRLVALMQQQPNSASGPDWIAAIPEVEETVDAIPDARAVDPGADNASAECRGGVLTVAGPDSPVAIEPVVGSHVNGVAEGSAVQPDVLSESPAEGEPERPRSDLLRQLDQAPLRLRCFGTRGVWLGERQVWPSSEAVEDTGWEVVVLLGIHPVAGVQAETLADTIWDEETPPDPGSVLRKRRRRLRQEIKRLVPELDIEPMPTDPKGRVYRLDPSVIASDVHRFVELAGWAKSLPRPDAIVAYEEALALYRGDLLDSVAVPTYTWLYDGAAIATSLRPDYRRLQEEVRLRLADLYSSGCSEDELGRAVDLYTELTGERPDDDRRWISLLRVHGRRGDGMGLEASLRRLRTALVELGQGDRPDTVRLPLNVQRVLEEVQAQLRAPAETAVG